MKPNPEKRAAMLLQLDEHDFKTVDADEFALLPERIQVYWITKVAMLNRDLLDAPPWAFFKRQHARLIANIDSQRKENHGDETC